MSNVYLGSINIFGFNFAPRGYAQCNGQLLAINTNTALFSLLGTQYGGNGTTTFALPDLRGRRPIHQGQGPGLSPYTVGQNGGTENTTLTVSNLPAHSHALNASQVSGATAGPKVSGSYLGRVVDTATNGTPQIYVPSGSQGTTVPLASGTIGNTGGGTPFSILDPYLTVNMCIALQGIFPTRS